MESVPTDGGLTRRTVIGVGAAALGASVLTGCGDGGSAGNGGADGYGAPAGPSGSGSPSTEPSPAPSDSAAPEGGGTALAKVADVPVGGAVKATAADGRPVIVAQPTRGELVAFSAICTHQGCTVAPAGKILACPCHGSTYDLGTGENTGGPAPRPLAEIAVTVDGDEGVEA
ncbi:MAG TPA: Rieske (2Fe-2S) protein [Actinoplanes sp.]|nr:Rieske (2Fe-2S) protein [Actinoplanes sp.]